MEQEKKNINQMNNMSEKEHIECFIMHRTDDDLIFVTTDENYANKLYESGDYTMTKSQILNPNENKFDVCTYSIHETRDYGFCHWSEGLNMMIIKDGVTIKLNSEEIQQMVKSLPRTFGGSY